MAHAVGKRDERRFGGRLIEISEGRLADAVMRMPDGVAAAGAYLQFSRRSS